MTADEAICVDPPQQRQPVLALPLGGAEPIGDDDHGSAGHRRHVGRAGQLSRKALDRRGLRDVERLAGRDPSGLVDERDRSHGVAPRQRVRDRAAELAGADDGDISHRWTIVRV